MANNYGRLHVDQDSRPKKSCRRWLITAIASVLLLTTIVSVAIVVSVRNKNEADNTGGDGDLNRGVKAIVDACQTTTYPDVCIEELINNPDALTTNPRQLVSVAVQIALNYVEESYHLASYLRTHDGGRTESMAVEDCIEMMDGANYYLKKALDQLSSLTMFNLKTELYDIMVWLSTAGSYEDTCASGFEDVPSNEVSFRSHSMRANQEKLWKVVAVAMGLANSLSRLGVDLSSWKNPFPTRRRILSMKVYEVDDAQGFPSWLEAWDRKLLDAPSPSSIPAPSSAPSPSWNVVPDAVVSKDGSGQYNTIQEAVNKIPTNRNKRWVIYIKAGVYNEYINLTKSHKNITFLGDGMGKSIITGNKNVALQRYTTFQTATVALSGEGFIAKGMTFQNTAGAIAHQAVALRVGADYMVFDACSFEGYQDTLYAQSSRQFYRGCDIYGTVDYIFGNAIAVFQKCRLLARQPLEKQKITYTAHGRSDSNDPSGYSFQSSSLVPASDFTSSTFVISAYFGRPWRAYSRSVFIGCFLDKHLHSAGWLPWNASNPYTDTVFYGEYKNTGPGANITGRVQWKGVHSAMSSSEASTFSVANFIAPLSWIESSNVPYDANLLV